MTISPSPLSAFTPVAELPLLTASLPGCGGALRDSDDFEVEEIPAYLPTGEGQHIYVWLQKRGLTTQEAISRLCQAVGAQSRQAGYAGLKDKYGVTRQWISLDQVDPAKLRALELPGLQVLDVVRHRNRLRTGHLRGNRFLVRLHGVSPTDPAHVRAALQMIDREGLPNYYGAQRFGMHGDNATRGLELLRGSGRLPRDKRQGRLIVSSLQSQLFNQIVAERLCSGHLRRMRDGDVLQRQDSGGVFASEELARDQPRVDAQELAITGPICGPKMIRPRDGSEARGWEDAQLARWELTPETFSRFGKLALGTRRALLVRPEGVEIEALDADTIEFKFSLPAGSYASVLLRELTKRDVIGRPTLPSGSD